MYFLPNKQLAKNAVHNQLVISGPKKKQPEEGSNYYMRSFTVCMSNHIGPITWNIKLRKKVWAGNSKGPIKANIFNPSKANPECTRFCVRFLFTSVLRTLTLVSRFRRGRSQHNAQPMKPVAQLNK
jgi:hypothetical protein